MPRSRASASIQPASSPAFGALKPRISPPAALTPSTSRFCPGSRAPLGDASTKTTPLPGATSGRSARSPARSSLRTASAPAFVTTASEPPPNIDCVVTELLELADLDAGLVAVAADLDPLDDAAVLRPEGRRHPGDGAARREVVVAPEVGDRRGGASGVDRAGGHPPDGIAHPDETDGPAAASWTGSGLTAAIDVPGAAAAAWTVIQPAPIETSTAPSRSVRSTTAPTERSRAIVAAAGWP